MNTKDILLFESGNGGQISIVKDDLVLNEVLYNQFYLALFGGNYEASTTGKELPAQGRKDYWANSLFFADDTFLQYNSLTERVLDNVALNSAGRIEIERAVNEDLSYLKRVFNYTVSVNIETLNKIVIKVNFSEKTSQEEKALQLVFDNAKKELIIQRII